MYPSRSSYKNLNLPKEFSLTDADSSKYKTGHKMTAPTELLARFVSTVMQKDYENALIFCKLGN